MKVYIFVDMEGISGISGSEFVSTDGRFYALGRKYYTMDVNACVRGCFNAGADGVIVRDGHGSGNHAIWEDLDPRVELVQGGTPGVRMSGLDECDALILLGYHAMAGNARALLEHTYSSKSIQNMWLNGKPVGEIGIDAGVGADYGIPTIMVSGDDQACAEAEAWIPGVVTCQVKKGTSCQGARLLSKETAHRLIEEKAAEAVNKIGEIKPVEYEKPITIRKELVERGQVGGGHGVTVIDGRTVEMTADTVEQALFRCV